LIPEPSREVVEVSLTALYKHAYSNQDRILEALKNRFDNRQSFEISKKKK